MASRQLRRLLHGAALSLLGVALFVPSLARADVVEMPPSCPAGSSAYFCHGPATCAPRSCVSSTDCMPGEVCAAQSLCIETHTCYAIPMSSLVDHVLGACDASGACASGACQSMFVCSPGPIAIDAGRDAAAGDSGPSVDAGVALEHTTYCGCRVGARSGGASALAMILVVSAAFVRRRSR